MKKDPLSVYLHDHLAGAALAIDLLEALGKRHAGEPLGVFANALLREIEADRLQLQQLAGRVERSTAFFKEAVARLLEKFTRLKFNRRLNGPLGSFLALEALALGILGKEALWTVLATVDDPRLAGFDYRQLALQARGQHARVEQRRLQVGQAALTKSALKDRVE